MGLEVIVAVELAAKVEDDVVAEAEAELGPEVKVEVAAKKCLRNCAANLNSLSVSVSDHGSRTWA